VPVQVVAGTTMEAAVWAVEGTRTVVRVADALRYDGAELILLPRAEAEVQGTIAVVVQGVEHTVVEAVVVVGRVAEADQRVVVQVVIIIMQLEVVHNLTAASVVPTAAEAGVDGGAVEVLDITMLVVEVVQVSQPT